MKQFDVYASPKGVFPERPCFVVIQHALLFSLPHVAVIPLTTPAFLPRPLTRLQPVLDINSKRFILLTEEVTNLPTRLCQDFLGNVESQSADIIRAVDMLLGGI